jgi:DNA/RNA-binding domain of Phe-tRNA-synthetase-like protein
MLNIRPETGGLWEGLFPHSKDKGGSMVEIRIQEDIFRDYPTFRRGIVVARDAHNKDRSGTLAAMLEETIADAAKHPIDIKSNPRTTVWNEAHRQFKSNPNKFPPAHCALLKRVQKPGTHIPFINRIVAIMNYNSIKNVTPVGGDDLMHAGQCLELRYATGSENFTPLGCPELREHPNPGEIIYVVTESNEVMCRRWNWRNGHKTRITEETQAIIMNIDVLGEQSEARAVETRDRVAGMLMEFCQAEIETTLMTPSNLVYRLDI